MPTETRKLVKARHKGLKDMPDFVFCCELQRENVAKFDGHEERVIPETAQHDCEAECQFCGAVIEGIVYVEVFGKRPLDLRWLDLDEGAYIDAH